MSLEGPAPLQLEVAGAGPQQTSASEENIIDDPYKMLVVAAATISAVSLLLSMIAVCLLCRVVSVYNRLSRTARDVSLSTGSGVEMTDLARGPKVVSNDEFLSFCEEDAGGGDAAQIRRVSQHFENFHGVAFAGQSEADFNGCWECIETFGLDEFLQAIKVGRLRRLAAVKAPWPLWQFTQKGNEITYINRSKFGVMTEAFKADGSEYEHKDLEGNVTTCRATLQDKSLIIERKGPQHTCTETRTIKNGDTMEFMLKMEGIAVTWGRRFTRKAATK